MRAERHESIESHTCGTSFFCPFQRRPFQAISRGLGNFYQACLGRAARSQFTAWPQPPRSRRLPGGPPPGGRDGPRLRAARSRAGYRTATVTATMTCQVGLTVARPSRRYGGGPPERARAGPPLGHAAAGARPAGPAEPERRGAVSRTVRVAGQ